MRVLIAGGAGFIGRWLCGSLLARGDQVDCVDNFATGTASNIEEYGTDPRFRFIEHDVCIPFEPPQAPDAVVNLASPASPVDYFKMPFETLRVGSVGTDNLLRIATDAGARYLQASTSEVYGDPAIHPQTEDYHGDVNPIGPRSVYDEAKRYGEAIVSAYRRELGLRTTIIRIFNTYGPYMRIDDGRAIPTLAEQALQGKPLTLHGDGSQTRSFCYVTDLVDGIIRAMDSGHPGPINLGNPGEFTILELAEQIIEQTRSSSELVFQPRLEDDPRQRCPDISLAQEVLGWQPTIPLAEGLAATLEAFRRELGNGAGG